MIVSLLLALTTPRLQAAETKVGYVYTIGERATYDLRGELPMGMNSKESRTTAKGQLKGTFIMRVLSVGSDGSAEIEFSEREMTIGAMGQTIPMPEAEPMRAMLDRQGFLLSSPPSGSFSAVLVLMFGVPGEALAVGRPFEWKPIPDGSDEGSPVQGGASATIKLRDVKDGQATLERSMTMKGGEKLGIVTTHDLATGRVMKGEVAMKGGEHGDFKVALTLKSVTKDPPKDTSKDGRSSARHQREQPEWVNGRSG